ncbi:MAG: hypothetical protein SFX72_19290 [Isosphaeraceae bacterium]|nr:hypothetical protein [Isosphaeraceae bacterium]
MIASPFSVVRRASMLVCASFALLSVVGCGGSSGLKSEEETSTEHLALRDVAEAYRVYTINNGKAPAKIADLANLEAVGANGINEAREGRLVVRMQAKLPDTSEEAGKVPSPEVLAYESKVPQEGGYVLLLDRTIKKMTPEEFKSAVLAGSEAPADPKAKTK